MKSNVFPSAGHNDTNPGEAGTRYIGALDEIELFNRALTASEIQSVVNAGSAGKCNGVIPLKIISVSRPANRHCLISGLTVPNLSVTIHGSADLITFDNGVPATANATGIFNHDDAGAVSATKRFYRATYP